MTLERYERLKIIGQGPMSVVWLARDRSTQKPVALKIMLVVSEDDRRTRKAQERFQREIEIARSLHHPHILPILNYGYMEYEERYVPFLVSPYLREGSLADLIREKPPWKYWSLLQTADAIMQAAESLWYLHTRNPQIVHQDVKPGNFLIRSLQTPQRAVHLYLCDFGISRWQRSSFTLASELLGTFAYMAPEQVERKVNCASDQYALAVMACYLLTGKLPIQAETNEAYAEAHLYESPIPPSQLNPERITSPQIDNVILRALEKEPAERFPSILHFARSLEQAIIQLARVKAAAKTERFTAAAASIAAPTHPLPPQPQPAHVESLTPIVLDPLELAEDRILDEPLPARPAKPPLAAQRNVEKPYTTLPLTCSARYELPGRPRMVCWSHNGSAVACPLYGSPPLILYRDGSMQEVRTADALHASSVCWSPGDRVLALSSHGEIHFWHAVSRIELPLILRLNARSIDALDWSAEGLLALWVEDQILLYTLSEPQLTRPLASPSQTIATGPLRGGSAGILRWSPDGSQLAAGAGNGTALVWHASHTTPARQLTEQRQKITSIAWSPDSSLLAATYRNNSVAAWAMPAGKCALLWNGLPAMPRTLSIATDQVIALASAEERLLFGLPGDPAPSMTCPGQLAAAWSPVKRELALLDEQRETSLSIWQR